MNQKLVKFKVLATWLLAVLFAFAQPVEANESFKEVEETEEVKLFYQVKKQVKQKPKPPSQSPSALTQLDLLPVISTSSAPVPRPRYILYCNLTYYG